MREVFVRDDAGCIKQYAKLAGLEPGDFGGHSLRFGFITTIRHHPSPVERAEPAEEASPRGA